MNRRDFLYASSSALIAPLFSCDNTANTQPIATNLNNSSSVTTNSSAALPTQKKKVVVPPEGKFYHGVHPGRPENESTGREDDFIEQDIIDYESENLGVNKKAAFIYFSNNWDKNKEQILFPEKMCKMIDGRGSIPFIRLMLRSTEQTNELEFECKNGKYKKTKEIHRMGGLSLDKIRGDKKLRAQLQAWGIAAKGFKEPIIVEWGTEMNGSWFEWNGWWNGKAEGVKKFKQTYQYIHEQVVVKGGADNITWVFHPTASDDPANNDSDCKKDTSLNWNRFEDYYPGDFIDWFGVSIYGAQKPSETECPAFATQMENAYKRFQSINKDKPIFVLEFGATKNSVSCGQDPTDCKNINSGAAKWANDALNAIFTNSEWKMLRGFFWWNEAFEDGEKVNMRVQDVPCLKETFQKHFQMHSNKIVERPII